jgi:AraC-like DNA-binding protein
MPLSSPRLSDQLVLLLGAMRASDIALREIALCGPDGHAQPANDDIIFLFNRAGEALIELEGRTPLPIRRGSFAAFPGGHGFSLRRVPGHDECILVGGRISLDRRRAGPLLAALPALLFMCPNRDLGIAWQDATFALIEDCARKADPGSQAVLQRLLESLFAITVQRALAAGDTQHQQVRTRNPAIGRALLLLQDQPGEAWNIGALARAVAMSTSSFARAFSALVGEPPMAYLTRLRMERAAQALAATNITLGALAGQLGYGSDAAFARAFHRFHGRWPGAFRRGV